MHEILAGIQKTDGIYVLWQEGSTSRTTLFSYGELIAQSVNVLDLVSNPGKYTLDEVHHRIIPRR